MLIWTSTPQPPFSTSFMNAVWTKIDAPTAKTQATWFGLLGRPLHHFWQVLYAQFSLIHKSTWIASALVCVFGLFLTLCMASHNLEQKHFAGNILVLFITVVGASGCAYIYGSTVDPGFEWTLATPVSVRMLMLCRMGIVLGYNLLLGMLVSAAFVTITGGGLWEMVQLWLAPLLFLSSLCLALSLFISSTFAVICAAIIGGLQHFPQRFASHLIPPLDISPTNPLLLFAALLIIICTVYYMPRQPRFVS
jgi:hypothetical protein